MKKKLGHIHSPWHRLVLTVLINGLLIASRFAGKRARIHWVGHPRRYRRLERPMIALLFLCAMILLEPYEYVVWAAIWGGVCSIFIILHTLYRVIPRKSVQGLKEIP